MSKISQRRALTAQDWIQKLGLERHPEGGYFKQTYRAALTLDEDALPATFHGPRSASTAIYFLIGGDDFSALHRLAADEVWHFHLGSPMEVHSIDPTGKHRVATLGHNIDSGQLLQYVVPGGCWFGSCMVEQQSFALVGCTVAPGFDFADFEMGDRNRLMREYPQHTAIVERLTRAKQEG